MLCNLRIKYVPIEVVHGFNLKPDLPFLNFNLLCNL